MTDWLLDLRHAVRSLAQRPTYTLLGVLTMALGVGAVTAIASVLYGVLLSPLPYPDGDRLVRVHATYEEKGLEESALSPADFFDYEQELASFSSMGAHSYYGLTLDRDGRPREMSTIPVTPRFFATFGVEAAHGRLLGPGDDPEDNVMVMGYGAWQKEFGGDESLVGKAITIDGEPWTLVGVLPEDFGFPWKGAELYIPALWGDPAPRGYRSAYTVGRLAPGVTLEEATAELATVAESLAAEYPDPNAGWSARLEPLKESVVGDAQPALVALFGAVVVLLLIACANVTNLMLARGSNRRHELATRAALGASRGQLIRLMLAESTLMAVVGGAAGLLLAAWGVDLLVAASPAELPRVDQIAIRWPVLAAALGLVLLIGPAVGLLPALQLSRSRVSRALSAQSRSTVDTRGSARLRRTLTVVEVALSLVLLAGAGLMLKSFLKLTQLDPGFNAEQTAAVQLFVYGEKYTEDANVQLFFEELEDRVLALPGVQAAGATTALPMNPIGVQQVELRVDGRAESEPGLTNLRSVTPGYFETLQRRLLAGRLFGPQDRPDGVRTVLLSQTAARRIFGDEDPLGERLRAKGDGEEWATVVGVVADARHEGLEVEAGPEIFYPFAQRTSGSTSLVVRTAGDPATRLDEIQQQVWEVDPGQAVYSAFPLSEAVADARARRAFLAVLVGVFAVLALILAAVGIYGVVSYSVARRHREFALRMALGATGREILRMVLREGSLLAGLGVALGLGLSLIVGRFLAALLFEVSANDPPTFGAVCVGMALIALAATFFPARRAVAVAPAESLKGE